MKNRIKHPLYRTWQNMLNRCLNPNNPGWPYYGGRGVTVCARWLSLAAFVADMGERPADHTLERIDNNRGYEPGNCRWATRTEQQQNTRFNRWTEVDGVRLTMNEWARRLGVQTPMLRHRSKVLGSVEAAIRSIRTTPRQRGVKLDARQI